MAFMTRNSCDSGTAVITWRLGRRRAAGGSVGVCGVWVAPTVRSALMRGTMLAIDMPLT
jgi:hypothetical protein